MAGSAAVSGVAWIVLLQLAAAACAAAGGAADLGGGAAPAAAAARRKCGNVNGAATTSTGSAGAQAPASCGVAAHEQQARAQRGQALLTELVAAGATVNVPLEVRSTGRGGLGVFVAAAVEFGAPIFELPSRLWLTQHGNVTSLTATIVEEMLRPGAARSWPQGGGPSATSALDWTKRVFE